VAEISEAATDIDEYLFIDTHITQIFRLMPSDDMLRRIIECAIRATSKVKNCVDSPVGMTYDVSRYVFTIVLFHI
jgi:hypothetical protein